MYKDQKLEGGKLVRLELFTINGMIILVMNKEIYKSKCLDIIATYKEKVGFMLHADNHVYLLIEVNNIPLS